MPVAITTVAATVKAKIDEKLTAEKLPNAYHWQQPPTHREAV